METIEPAGVACTSTEHEPQFLLVRDTSGDWPRRKRAAVGSVAFHVVAIATLLLIRSGPTAPPPPPEHVFHPFVTKLYIPKDLTQKAPNKGPVAKLMLSRPSAPAPKITPPAPIKTKAASPAPPAPAPVPAAPKPIIPPAPVALPPAENARTQAPVSAPPPAAAPKATGPKLIVEDSLQAHPPAPKPGGRIAVPADPIAEAMRTAANRGTGAARTSLGDSPELSIGAGLHMPAAAARLSNFQLKSDPMGVDFWPYLQQVLAEVKLNWAAVYPQAARLGLRGVVTVEFAVAKDGTLDKVVWDQQTGARALDNAAVAAISASNPLPALPKEFKGDRIVLEMSFMYNMPR